MAVVLFLLAFVCFLIAAALGFGVFAGAHVVGWVALGLVFSAAAWIAGVVPRP